MAESFQNQCEADLAEIRQRLATSKILLDSDLQTALGRALSWEQADYVLLEQSLRNEAKILAGQTKILAAIAALKPGPAVAGHFSFSKGVKMSFNFPDDSTQPAVGTLDLTDSAGQHSAAVDSVVWSLDSPQFVSMTPSADGLSASFTPIAVGTTQVTATVTAGPNTFMVIGTLIVVAGEAVAGTMNFQISS